MRDDTLVTKGLGRGCWRVGEGPAGDGNVRKGFGCVVGLLKLVPYEEKKL